MSLFWYENHCCQFYSSWTLSKIGACIKKLVSLVIYYFALKTDLFQIGKYFNLYLFFQVREDLPKRSTWMDIYKIYYDNFTIIRKVRM